MTFNVIVVGAGFSGLGAAIRLDREGRGDFLILEAGAQVGGTWRDNRYPGAACDIPSRLYSLSFASSTSWSSRYPGQEEIQDYLVGLVDRFDLGGRLRLNTPVLKAHWDGKHWILTTPNGVFRATYVVFAIGALRIPRIPQVPGRFDGPAFHSARWQDVDLTDKRVGVVGTGASAVQLVPAIVDRVRSLHVFQRTPPWVRQKVDRPYGRLERAAVTHVPGLEKALRIRRYWKHERYYPVFFGKGHRWSKHLEPLLRWEISRRAGRLAAQVTPDYRFGCKRILAAEGWYEALQRSDLQGPVRELVSDGVVADRHTQLDVLIWATGFQVDDPLEKLEVTGPGGSLRQVWGSRPRALRGILMPGFPNAFMLLGPNTALGHNSVVIMIEAQIRWMLDAMRLADERGAIEARQDALDAWIERMDRDHAERVWSTGCDSWYLGKERKNFSLYPGSTVRYVLETWRVRPEEVRFV